MTNETYTWQVGFTTGESTRVEQVLAQEHKDGNVWMHSADGELLLMAPHSSLSYMKRLDRSLPRAAMCPGCAPLSEDDLDRQARAPKDGSAPTLMKNPYEGTGGASITITNPTPESAAEALARANDPRYRGKP